MPNQRTDADLIRICLESPIEDFSDDVVSALTQRIEESESIRSSVLESPIADAILDRIGVQRQALEKPPQNSSRGAVSVLALIAACLLGFSISWIMRDDKDVENDTTNAQIEPKTDTKTLDSNDSDDKQTAITEVTPDKADDNSDDSKRIQKKTDTDSTQAKVEQAADAKPAPDLVEVKEPPKVAWSEVFDPDKPALTFEQAAWRMPGSHAPDMFNPDDFRAWFEGIRGRPWSVTQEKVASSSYTRFDGQARLKAPWVDRAVMRLTPYDIEQLSMFFWRGDEGVRIRYFRSKTPHVWAAHRVTRNRGTAEINELLTSDNARWARTYFGTFEVRSQNGNLLLMRGDLPFLKVALGGLPEEVILEGKFKLRQLEFYRSDPVPDEIVDKLRMPMGRVLVGGDVQNHEWKTNLVVTGEFAKIETGKFEKANSGTQREGEKPKANAADSEARESEPVVVLSTQAASKQLKWAHIPVPEAGLCEFVFRVTHADFGTGIYLGDEKGEPLYQIGYVWDPNARRLAYSYLAPGKMLLEKAHDPNTFPPPYCSPSQYVRIVIGAGMLTTWISTDGEHWGWMGEYPTRSLTGRHQTIGIYALPGAERSIELAELEIREFPFVAGLATERLVELFDPEQFNSLDVRDFGSWMHVVIRTQPLDANFDDWRRTCAVETLRRVPNRALGLSLWHGLLTDRAFGRFESDDAQEPGAELVADANQADANHPGPNHPGPNHPGPNSGPVPAKGEDGAQNLAREPVQRDADFANEMYHLLAEASLFINVYDVATATQLGRLYHSVAEQIVINGSGFEDAEGNRRLVTTTALSQYAAAPQWTTYAVPIAPQEAAKRELLLLIQEQRHADALKLIDRLVFWHTNGHPNHSWWSPVDPIYATVAWAELMAHSSLGSDAQAERISRPRRWKTTLLPMRHPLAQPVNKEAYNVMAEFNAALSGDAYGDACQVIASAGDANTLGLLPDQADERLLIAFPKAVAMAMDRHPQLRSSMNEKYGAIGQLRVREAMKTGDANQIEAATVQFFGTIAAAECEQWLGDRAMAAGQFSAARKYFTDALAGYRRNSQVETAKTKRLESRLHLVNSMLGQTIDANVELPATQFGSQQLTTAQMKALTTELSQVAATQSGATQGTNTSVAFHAAQITPKMLGYQAQPKAKFDGDHGEAAGRSGSSTVNWFSRQLSYAQEGQFVYLGDRFQLRCLDLTNGTTKWKQELGGEHGNAHYWPLHPMRPLINGNHIFYRRYTKTGAELACFEKASGKLLWRFKPPNALVSDPFLVRGRLQILASQKAIAGPVQIRLLTVHPQTGAVVQDDSVLTLLDESQLPEHLSQVMIHDDLIVFTVSGTVACCDSQGQTLWVRKQSWTIPALDPTRSARAWEPPIAVGDTLIVSQPGVRMLECLDAHTGQLVWTYLAPQMKRIVGVLKNRIVLETNSGFESIDTSSGELQWTFRTVYLNDAAMLIAKPEPAATAAPATKVDPAIPQSDVLLCVRHRDIGKSIRRPEFVWVDLSTGVELAYAPLANLDDKQPRLGPFLSFQDRLFAFFAKGYKEPNPDLVEFTQKADGTVFRTTETRWTAWLPASDPARSLNPTGGINLARTGHHPNFTSSLPRACPGWSVSAPPQSSSDCGLKDALGRTQVFAIKLSPRGLTEKQQTDFAVAPLDTARLIREVTIPTNPNASLTLTVGHDKGKRWQLIVEAAGCRLHSSIIDDKSAPNGWQDINLTFGHLCGKKVQLIVAGAPLQPAQLTWIYLDNLKNFKIE
jgi:outer membrane protein assembly factor BamB